MVDLSSYLQSRRPWAFRLLHWARPDRLVELCKQQFGPLNTVRKVSLACRVQWLRDGDIVAEDRCINLMEAQQKIMGQYSNMRIILQADQARAFDDRYVYFQLVFPK